MIRPVVPGPGAPSGGAPGPGWLTVPRAVAVAGLVLLLGVWVSSGSLVLALLVLVLVGAAAGLGVVLLGWAGRGPRPDGEGVPGADPDGLPTSDLAPPPVGERVRRGLRGLLSRPWVRGDGLVRAAARRLASEDAMVWTPRGQRVAAPHLWVEWNTADVAEIAARWPLAVLADELLAGYLEHVGETGARRVTEQTRMHLLASADVPVGRVVVTAAFSRPQETPLVSVSGPSTGSPGADRAPLAPSPGPAGSRAPAHPPRTARTETLGQVVRRHLPGRARPADAVLVALTPGVRDVTLDRPRVTVGRDPQADAVVDRPGVSWRHLALTRGAARAWTVVDTGSTNGTTVGGRRITAPVLLRDGDTLGLGHDGPRFRLALAPAGPRPTPTRREATRQEVA